jgi:hypothetical protein
MDPIKELHHILCKSLKMCNGDPGNDKTSVRGRKHEPYTERPNSPRSKNGDMWRAKSRACSFSLTSRGLLTKNSSWQVKQLIPHTTVTFYGDCVKMWDDFAPNFGDKRTGCNITTKHRITLPFSPGNFLTKMQHECTPPTHPIFPCFPDWT